ncbi:MAG: putative glycine dehydrogenase (decarboxylating) subunit 2 [Candidatus Heimdallarchaeota archaeon LC_2]|nr:MAG: putative glycine dehydrogenase (decarboxylating) subunit 2 [Candidatus Heimdallarchaeota archaeon LC_2]
MKKRTQAKWNEDLIMNQSYTGRRFHIPEKFDIPTSSLPDEWQRKTKAELPEVSELQVVRHVVRLSQMNHGVDVGEYPLGSCTMKYNPKVNERIAKFSGFSNMHPNAPESAMQGTIEVIYRLQEAIKLITGLPGVTVQPAAGAQGEYVGLLIARNYFAKKGEMNRMKIMVPDSAHGTNPASAAMAGFKVVEIPSNHDGFVDMDALKAALDDSIAVFMITNPNTLGLFEPNILEISKLVHEAGALMYLDGANYNGIVGMLKPGDMGFDIMHLNMHKTFSGPHGGGGPGCGPVAVAQKLEPFLPYPLATYTEDSDYYHFDFERPDSIGRVHTYFGNFGIILRTLAFLYRNGGPGIRDMCKSAVLNANYLMYKFQSIKGFSVPFAKGVPRKHEFVASPLNLMRETGVNAGDIAKAILDYGIHSPTVYFPLIVKEALMIEPTEAETKFSLDRISEAFQEISDLAYSDPEIVKHAPYLTGRSRLDEFNLAKNPILSERQKQNQ